MPLFSSKTPFKIEKVDLTTTLSLKQWSCDNLKQWLLEGGYDKKTVIDPIYKQQFDGSAIIIIKPEDLIEIGIPRGAVLSLLSKIKDLVDKQIKLGLIQDSNMTTGLQLSKSPRGMISPRSSQTISPSNVSPRNSNNEINNGQPLTSTTMDNKNTTVGRNISSDDGGVHPHHHSLPATIPQDSNNNQKKPPLVPRKSENTLLLQAKVVQHHQDIDSENQSTNSETNEKLEDELTFDFEHGLRVSKLDINSSQVSNSTSMANEIHIADAPLWNYEELNEKQREQFNYCYAKLKGMIETHGEKPTQTVCQNLSFAERFRYKYLNVMSAPRFDNSKVEPFMKVKLIITEMDDGSLHRFIRKFGSLLNNPTIQKMKFGMFHAALIIGPWYLEWGNSSIAVVRNRSSAKAVFAMDIGRVKGESEVSLAIDKLSAICTHFNTRKEYDNKKCNCQHFVEAVLDHLGLKNTFEEKQKGPLRKYLETLKKEGVCEMSYRVDAAIRDLIQMDPEVSEELKLLVNEKYIIFHSHRILDEFVKAIEKKSKLYFEGAGVYEYQLLKAFDRAFWLQTQSSKQVDATISQPLTINNICMCPFNQEHSEMEFVNNTIIGIDYEFGNLKTPTPILRK